MEARKLSAPIPIKLFQADVDALRRIKDETGFSVSALVRNYVRERIASDRERANEGRKARA